ncbi:MULTISPECIES: hypothetical protein [unclassified Marinovum]
MSDSAIPRKSSQRGIALILVLWFSVLLALIATAANQASRNDIALALNTTDAYGAELAADGALDTALYIIMTGEPEDWFLDGTPYAWGMNGAEVRVAVWDERQRTDLNTASEAALVAMFLNLRVTLAEATTLARGVTEYRAAARSDFRSTVTDERLQASGHFAFGLVEEIGAVPGVSADLAQRIATQATVYTGLATPKRTELGAPPRLATGALPPARFPATTQPLPLTALATDVPDRSNLLRLRAEAVLPGGGAFAREAVVMLGGAQSTAPYDRRLWRRVDGALFPAPETDLFEQQLE